MSGSSVIIEREKRGDGRAVAGAAFDAVVVWMTIAAGVVALALFVMAAPFAIAAGAAMGAMSSPSRKPNWRPARA